MGVRALSTPSLVLNLFNQKILCAMGKRETWKFIIQTLAAILSAIATSFGVASCCCEVIRF